MKKMTALLLVQVFLFSATALAEGKLKVTEKNLFVYAGDDNGCFYAKVENVGDVAVGVDSGDLVIFSEDDDIILTDSYITTLPSYIVLQPGDYLYVKEFLWNSALKNAAIGDYKFSVPMRKSTKTFTKVPCEATFELEGTDSYENYVYVTFTNTSEEPIYDFYIVAALHDADGNLVFVDSKSLSNVAVHPGSTVTTKLYVDRDLMEHYKMNSIVPATVDAMVLFSNE